MKIEHAHRDIIFLNAPQIMFDLFQAEEWGGAKEMSFRHCERSDKFALTNWTFLDINVVQGDG
jgi:hypothetical protein